MPFPDAVQQLLCEQYQVCARRQLTALGCTHGTVSGWIDRGHLRLVPGHWGVLGVPSATSNAGKRIWAAVLRAGDGARATAGTALGLAGVEGFELTGRPQIAVPPGRRLGRVPFEVLPAAVADWECTTVGGIPAVRPQRAFLEAASGLSAKRRRTTLDELRRRGFVRVDRLEERCLTLPGHAGAAAALDLLRSGAARQESEGERELAPAMAAAGIELTWGVWITPNIRADGADLPARTIVEYDGRDHHTLPSDVAGDTWRDLEAKAAGYEVIRVNADMLQRRRQQTVAMIAAVLAQRRAMGLPRLPTWDPAARRWSLHE